MNPYDRSHFSLEQYDFAPMAGVIRTDGHKRTNRICMAVFLLALVAMTAMLLLHRTWFILLLYFAAEAVALCALLKNTQCMLCHAAEAGMRVLHDYYYESYWRSKRVRRDHSLLMVMAKCDLLDHRPQLAADALEQIVPTALSTQEQNTVSFLWAVYFKLTDQETEFQREKEYFSELVSGFQASPHNMKLLQALEYGTTEALTARLRIERSLRALQRVLNTMMTIAIAVVLAVLFFGVPELLPYGIAYRSGFWVWGTVLFVLAGFVLPLLLAVWVDQSRRLRGSSVILHRIVSTLLLVAYGLAACFFGLLSLIDYEVETPLENGTILVEQVNFLDPSDFSVWKPITPFLRRYLYDSDQNGTELTEQEPTQSFTEELPEESTSFATESVEGSSDEVWLKNIYQAIYDAEFSDSGKELSYGTSAKGWLYATVGAQEAQETPEGIRYAQLRLVYDRESQNGLCYEVVCYEYHYDADGNQLDNTSILNFYAVVKADNTVIPADKTSWAESGSQEYRNAVGE